MTLSTQDSPTTTASDGSAVEIPSNFICPITLQVMVAPVMTRTGLNFERAAIFSWLYRGSDTCPLTRKPLAASDLITNRRLKTHIGMWKKTNGIPEPTEEEMAAAEYNFVGFLNISNIDKEEILAPTSPQRAGRSSRPARQSGQRRRNFLSRILTSATAVMDNL
jgi:hypothetical protein